jgi:hypothetical protein
MKRAIIRRQRERGFTILAYCLMIFVVLGFTGLAVDVGYLQWQRRLLQAAADAASMGALREMELGRTNAQPHNDLTTAAQNDASLNGFTDGQNNVTVTLNNPPTSGTFSGDNTAAQAIVTKVYPTFFMRVLGTSSVTLSAQSVAQTTTSYGSIGGCIFALNPTASDALDLSSGTTLNTSCSAVDESNASEALKIAGSITWNMTSHNAHVGVVGGYKMTGGASIIDTTLTPNKSENPVTITSPGDPLANILAPTLASVTGGIQAATPQDYGTVTLNSGIYCGGISSHGTLTFNPGTYVLAGGGFSLGAQASATGTHITFYSTSSTGWGCGSSYTAGGFSTTGQASVTFTAPVNGPLVGMLFFQDRNDTTASGMNMVGGTGCSCDGALYFKKGNVKLVGNSSQNGYMVVVGDTVEIHGASKFGNNYTSLTNPNPFAPGSTGGGLVQ